MAPDAHVGVERRRRSSIWSAPAAIDGVCEDQPHIPWTTSPGAKSAWRTPRLHQGAATHDLAEFHGGMYWSWEEARFDSSDRATDKRAHEHLTDSRAAAQWSPSRSIGVIRPSGRARASRREVVIAQSSSEPRTQGLRRASKPSAKRRSAQPGGAPSAPPGLHRAASLVATREDPVSFTPRQPLCSEPLTAGHAPAPGKRASGFTTPSMKG